MLKLTPKKQAEVDQIFSKIYAGLPPEAKAKVDQIRAEGAQDIRDREIEFEARIKQVLKGTCRLMPISELAWSAVFAAHRAEPLESRKDLAAYESGRAFIRAIKAALLDGRLVAREQGSGIPVNDRSWCLENDTLLSLPKMMPHDRLMVRTDEVKAWLEKMGIAIDAFPLLKLATEGISLRQQAPTKAEPEEPTGQQSTYDAKESGTESPSKSKPGKKPDILSEAIAEALAANQSRDPRILWEWIVAKSGKWAISYDKEEKTLSWTGKAQPVKFEAFQKRLQKGRMKTFKDI